MRPADLVTAARIPLSLALLFVPPLGNAFLLLYALCGASDVLDGFLARAQGGGTVRGARWDSLADLALVATAGYRLWPLAQMGPWTVGCLCAIAAVRLAALGLIRARWGAFGFFHTYANKATGAALFLWPFVWRLTGSAAMLYAVSALATLAALEELLIAATARTWEPDRKSLLFPAPGRADG